MDSGRALLSYFVGDKNSSNQLSITSSNSHRDSISSIKSLNSDDEGVGGSGGGIGVGSTPTTTTNNGSRTKIILDETVNPKRPLRPTRVTTQNSTSSPSNSNQSSRPISHLSGEELNSVSMQQINVSLSSSKFSNAHLAHDELDELNSTMKSVNLQQPPPKPPKTATLKFKFNQNGSENGKNGVQHHSGNSNSQSSEDLIQSDEPYDHTKSSTSLNSLQFRYLSAKTTSDSILNRVYFGRL